MKHSLNSRKTKDVESPIGNYQEIRKQISNQQVKKQQSINSKTNIGNIDITKPLQDQRK